MGTKIIIGLLCVALLCFNKIPSPVYADEAEPPFPQLIGFSGNRVKIVSESVDERLGRQTSQEYHDTIRSQSAYITSTLVGTSQTAISVSSGSDYQIRFISWPHDLAYFYKPFQCKVSKISDLSRSLFDEEKNWNWNYKTAVGVIEHRYYGVLGLWMQAQFSPRTFSRAEMVYSAAKDIHRDSLLWTVRDEENKLTIKLYFIQHDQAGGNDKTSSHRIEEQPSLEKIEIDVDDAGGKTRTIRTINILSVDYTEKDDTYEDLFQPPVGFGCFSTLIAEGDARIIESRRRDADKWNDWAQHSLHAELEVTATSYELVSSPTGSTSEKAVSETYNVEVAQSKVQALLEQDFIEMIRLRNTGGDQKVVINHMMRVLYTIDMRAGSCEMSHINTSPEKQDGDSAQPENKKQAERTGELYEIISLKFKNNNLKLDIGVRIFKDPGDLHFVKTAPASTKQPELHYYEGSANDAFKFLEEPTSNGGARRKVRMIQTYTLDDDGNLTLHSITIWVLNEQQTRILESYLINILSARELTPGWPEEVKMFDVSEECYLENERMIQNRDYAWLELTYPATSRALNMFASNEQELKREFYERAVTDFSRVPRVEVLFEEDSFILRILKLDVPTTELLYDKVKNKVLEAAENNGDISYQAPDLTHCGHYCRLHLCTVMSYCHLTSVCILSSRRLIKSNSEQPENEFIYSDDSSCDTYKIPPIIERNKVLKDDRLHSTIAKYQHQNYGVASLPKVPDEIALPRSETGLSSRDFVASIKEYEATLEKALESDNRLPELSISALLGDHYSVFVPSKFELENDPMREFNIYDGTDDDEDLQSESNGLESLPRFHGGLPAFRYNLAAPAATSEDTRDEVNFRTFSDLTYDQCAMACADSKCGSFSFCKNQAGDCVLSNINSTGRAITLGVTRDDRLCSIYQRDFLRNFDKFQSVPRPQFYTKTSDAGDASQCALSCVSETNFKCLSFEFCDKSLTASAAQGVGQCYFQTERHLPAGEKAVAEKKKNKTPAKPQNGNSQCDHYSRSYLADFVRLENRKLADSVVEQLKTSSFNGLSVFTCAEKCATSLLDCTGFQFCHLQDAITSQQTRECTTIESKISKKVLEAAGQSDDTQTVVDEKAGGRILHAGKYLQFDEHCQVFALGKDTAESHLRDLAFDGVLKTKEEEDKAKLDAQASKGGLGFTGGFMAYLLAALVGGGVACGLTMLKGVKPYVQQRVDRLRILVGR